MGKSERPGFLRPKHGQIIWLGFDKNPPLKWPSDIFDTRDIC